MAHTLISPTLSLCGEKPTLHFTSHLEPDVTEVMQSKTLTHLTMLYLSFCHFWMYPHGVCAMFSHTHLKCHHSNILKHTNVCALASLVSPKCHNPEEQLTCSLGKCLWPERGNPTLSWHTEQTYRRRQQTLSSEMESQRLCRLFFMPTWMFVFLLPIGCSGASAPRKSYSLGSPCHNVYLTDMYCMTCMTCCHTV